MEYVLEEDARGKKTPRKVGMAPIQREGMEYELDVVGDLDVDLRDARAAEELAQAPRMGVGALGRVAEAGSVTVRLVFVPSMPA